MEQAPRRVPRAMPFVPIQLEDAKARATVDEWRTFSVLLEPQVRGVFRHEMGYFPTRVPG